MPQISVSATSPYWPGDTGLTWGELSVSDFVLTHTQKWLDHFTQQGYRASPLAAGVEGAIYDLGGDLIAKVWRVRRPGELELMQHFYADVAKAGLPFKTPEILTIEQVDGVSVTYERKLPGRPLQQRLTFSDRGVEPVAARSQLGPHRVAPDPLRCSCSGRTLSASS
jgi:hypothetical protein